MKNYTIYDNESSRMLNLMIELEAKTGNYSEFCTVSILNDTWLFFGYELFVSAIQRYAELRRDNHELEYPEHWENFLFLDLDEEHKLRETQQYFIHNLFYDMRDIARNEMQLMIEHINELNGS